MVHCVYMQTSRQAPSHQLRVCGLRHNVIAGAWSAYRGVKQMKMIWTFGENAKSMSSTRLASSARYSISSCTSDIVSLTHRLFIYKRACDYSLSSGCRKVLMHRCNWEPNVSQWHTQLLRSLWLKQPPVSRPFLSAPLPPVRLSAVIQLPRPSHHLFPSFAITKKNFSNPYCQYSAYSCLHSIFHINHTDRCKFTSICAQMNLKLSELKCSRI